MSKPSLTTVCPRCANGHPVCSDHRPDGTRYPHNDTCATYRWGDLCPPCEKEVFAP